MKEIGRSKENTMNKKRLYIKNYGCQMNVRDSEALAGLLQEAGFVMSDSPDDADVILFNTCSVREHAEERIWSNLGQLKKKHKRPVHKKPIIGVIGCMAQNYKDEIFRRAANVDLVAGPNDLLSVPILIKNIFKEKSRALAVSTMEREQDFYVSNFRQDKNHAYVVISEGCSNFCSYCVVPYVRGRIHCRNFKDILDEINHTIALGIKDVTLLGQNVNSYRYDDVDFVKLLKIVNDIKELKQFSFLTSHPKDLSEGLLPAMRDLEKIKKSLHLPVQSGSDRILKMMNRGYDASHYRKLAGEYRRIVGGQLSTDVIVGFPTETEEDFKKTCDLFKEIQFDSAYIFKYSPRPHTEAEKMADDVPLREKERRHKVLLDLQKSISKGKRC
ncbi:MAG: tRNA (N6-isopentenyl adenosine(37)-C2)-methylthiotransferase MiaB [Candidatus Omnitrophica bacterium]|nr:tRNA (N6-isopentenyl adenosine(37)-C2)-methylthiotransferase MiaB [Candidatus Omnitrophota bacterium]HOX54332.1 tRNA (N6-isopentenyl adenosine(37)-C2)-methylthiotransferase MiaB [Candidatus Omnitrophota bacterium]